MHIIIGAIGNDPSNPAVELIKNILSDKQYKNSISGNKPIIISKDPFARNQLLMVINTPNIKKAEEYANKNNEKIKSQYLSLFKKRKPNSPNFNAFFFEQCFKIPSLVSNVKLSPGKSK